MFLLLGLGSLYLRFETCLECIILHVCSYLRNKHKLLVLSCLSYFMTCSKRFNIQSEVHTCISALEQRGKTKFSIYMFTRDSCTQIVNNVTLE